MQLSKFDCQHAPVMQFESSALGQHGHLLSTVCWSSVDGSAPCTVIIYPSSTNWTKQVLAIRSNLRSHPPKRIGSKPGRAAPGAQHLKSYMLLDTCCIQMVILTSMAELCECPHACEYRLRPPRQFCLRPAAHLLVATPMQQVKLTRRTTPVKRARPMLAVQAELCL